MEILDILMIGWVGFFLGAIMGAFVFMEAGNVVIEKQVVNEVCQELSGNENAYYRETAGRDYTFVCVVPSIEILDEGLIIIERR